VQGAETAARHADWNISIYPYGVKPTRFAADGRTARAAGYYTRPLADGSLRHFGYFIYSLIKGADDRWRIAAETYIYQPVRFGAVKTAKDAIADMDRMGVRVAAVMSNAYYFDAVRLDPVADPYPKVRAENDWTAEQVRQYPGRLFGFCSFNPLKDYALAELDRCAASGAFTGLKLHFNGAQLKFREPAEVARVKAVMAAANARRLPMIIHVRPGNDYGREEAEIFLRQLVAAAPDVPIQIAHLWGGETFAPEALAVYADAVASGDPAARNLFFDVSGTWSYSKPEDMAEIVRRMRQIGMDRLLYASDAPPDEAWKALREQVPLTPAELEALAGNRAPYFP
jgi:predicted TIM-barrel fold metal-dependent hydrolase